MANPTQKIPTGARVVLGLVFFVFGLNGFLKFLPLPDHPGAAGAFLGALSATGYMFPMIKMVEIVTGALLLGGRFVPMALVVLAPVNINIVAFHLFLDAPASVVMPAVLVALHVVLAYAYRHSFAGLLEAKATPAR